MRRIGVLLLLATLGGCSWFGGDKADVVEPAKLESIATEVTLERAWDRRIGGKAYDRASTLVPAVSGGRIFAASADGNVMALTSGGRVLWEVNVRDFYSSEERDDAFAKKMDAITGGVGAGGDLAVVGTSAGEIVALNQSDGSLAWRSKTTSEVLAPPALDGDLVVAQSIDGKVAGFDALDGERRWIYSTSVPRLTLRGTSTPTLTGEIVVAGFANGRVVALDRQRGLAGIDERIAVSQGKSDLERLVDVDGRMILSGMTLYAVAYQGALTALELNEGRPIWQVESSSTAGLGAGFGNIYVAHADGRLIAHDESDGDEVWVNDALMHRQLTTPVTISSYVAVGDLEGYIHLIAQSDGRFVGRHKVDGNALRSRAVVDGSRLYIMTTGGQLLAFELR
ncbi:MAG: outer membrane protein assembly factor BamB [Gammaproteobacteria bacterium]|nr:outer membrane protein assembly factor BamB [Gammaproteobacteria bacterium]